MAKKPTYEELEQRIKELEKEVIELKQTEKTLRENEELFNILAEETGQLMFFFNPETGKIKWTGAVEAITGYTLEEYYSFDVDALIELVHPDNRKMVMKTMNHAVKNGTRFDTEYRLRRKDGSYIYVEEHGSFVSGREGKLYPTVGTISNITERKQAEEAKQQALILLQSAEDIGMSGCWSQSLQADRQVVWSQGEYQIHGLPLNVKPSLKLHLHCVHPEDREEHIRLFKEHLASNQTHFSQEYRIQKQDGTIKHIQAKYEIFRDYNGRPVTVRGTNKDITEQKQIETALRESEERFRTIAEDMPVLICRFLPDGEITYVNKAYDYFANTPEEFIGSNFLTLIPESDWETVMANICALTIEEPTLSHEHRVILPGNDIRWQRWTSRALFDNKEQLIAYQSIGEDITERKGLEEQLRQATKMEAVGRLAGGVAHDFNNALTPIIGISDMLLMELTPNHSLFGRINEIKKAGDRCASLTRQLLAFGRQQQMELKVFNLNDVVINVETLLLRVIGEDIDFIKHLEPDLENTKADINQIEQILVNLAVNARDAMPTGGKLTIETSNVFFDDEYASSHVSVAPGHYVMLAVSDTGVGMDDEVKSNIFEPFFTTKEKGRGTGLGLSTVYGIVKQSGGNIWVYSEPGIGTTFKTYLPCVNEKPDKLFAKDVPITEKLIGSETILLVEDDADARKAINHILTEHGYIILEASSGEEAIRLREQYSSKIHLLATDVVMPGISGRELADQLIQSYPDMKVLFMSGYTDDAILNHGVLEKETHFVQKPFTVNSITKKIREVLDE